MTLNERVSWAMNNIMHRYKLNYNQIGQALDINKNTVHSYLAGRGNIIGRSLSGLVKNYGFNGEWLITGHGEPFAGAREQYPDICGDPGISEDKIKIMTDSVIKQQIDQGIRPAQDPWNLLSPEQKINIEESMGKAYKILISDDIGLSYCFNMIIQQLSKSSEELHDCREKLKEKQKQIDSLRKELDNRNPNEKSEKWF